MLAELKQTPAPSKRGRLAQLLKAAGLTAPFVVATPEGPAAGPTRPLRRLRKRRTTAEMSNRRGVP